MLLKCHHRCHHQSPKSLKFTSSMTKMRRFPFKTCYVLVSSKCIISCAIVWQLRSAEVFGAFSEVFSALQIFLPTLLNRLSEAELVDLHVLLQVVAPPPLALMWENSLTDLS